MFLFLEKIWYFWFLPLFLTMYKNKTNKTKPVVIKRDLMYNVLFSRTWFAIRFSDDQFHAFTDRFWAYFGMCMNKERAFTFVSAKQCFTLNKNDVYRPINKLNSCLSILSTTKQKVEQKISITTAFICIHFWYRKARD